MSVIRPRIFLPILLFVLCSCGSGERALSQPLPSPDNNNSSAPGTPPETPPASGSTLTHPASDASFSLLPNGKSLSSIKVSGSSLALIKGTGTVFTNAKMSEYLKLKKDSQENISHAVHWSFMNLDTHEVIAQSKNAGKRIFGASSSKIYVGAALLDKQKGQISNAQIQKMADMIVVSSNTAWTSLQQEVGDGNANKGREYIYNFTQDLGHAETRGFQGYLGDLHGNELLAYETVDFLYDIYTKAFPGAETLWKLMYTSRTGASRGKKYIPKNIFVGGKTGTYAGQTENPETGASYNVNVRNHVMVFNINGVQYGLAVFANNGSDESAALLAGGLIREYAGVN